MIFCGALLDRLSLPSLMIFIKYCWFSLVIGNIQRFISHQIIPIYSHKLCLIPTTTIARL